MPRGARGRSRYPRRRTAVRRRELCCLIAAILAGGAAGQNAAAREVPFTPQTPITTFAYSVHRVTVADVDGDKDFDALSASFADDTIAWFENTSGDGSTWSPHDISTAANGARVAAAGDFDGDGDTDVLAASTIDDKIAWHENTAGDGSAWATHTISLAANGVISAVVADVDGDGDADVVSALALDDAITWYENDGGGGGWTLHVVSMAIDGPQSVIAADVDGDGDLDVVCASNYDDNVTWFENTSGDGTTWTIHTINPAVLDANSVFAADVDGDGDLDVLSTSVQVNKLYWHENDGSGVIWTTHTISSNTPEGLDVAAHDLDSDGDVDVIHASHGIDGVSWYENDGAGGTWTLRTVATGLDVANSTATMDMDGDGDLDVVASASGDNTIRWYRNDTIHRSATHPGQTIISTSANGATAVFTADLDRDGDLDALSASGNDDKIAWYENDGAGIVWTLHTISTNALIASSVFAADVDDDGDLDALAAANLSDRVAWYENDGTGSTWTMHTISAVPYGPLSVFAADVDGDGDLDALSASYLDSMIAWYENDGAGATWTLHTISTTAVYAQGVFAGDVDGDGDLDALSASGYGDDKIAWYENDGTGTSWTLHTISTAAQYAYSVFAADVDGDGDLDALSASGLDNKIAWYENNGTGTAWTLHTITENAMFAYEVFAADVDGDGDIDALSASYFDNKIAWYENDGTGGGWTLHTISLAAYGAQSVFAADVDGDGDLDAVSASFGDDKIAWYENRGGQFALPTLDVSQKLASNGQRLDLLDIQAVHRGRMSDSNAELVTLELTFTDDGGVDLMSGEANALIEDLHVYLDDGSGTFEDGADTPVTSVPNLVLTAGVQTVTFADDNANVQFPFGGPRVYFVVADMTADAQSQVPSAFQVGHITESSSTGEDAANDIPLTLEFFPNTGTGVIDTVLDNDSCTSPFDLQIADRTVSVPLTCQAGTFLRARDFVLTGSADVRFRAGETVRLQPGFSVQSGQFAIEIDPSLKP